MVINTNFMRIKEITAREILDSRGNPTIETDVRLDSGHRGRAAVPSGTSTGKKEAVELRDGEETRFCGKGVLRAVANVRGEIFRALKGMDASRQSDIDYTMLGLDGTSNKSRLGANAILSVSIACARAAAAAHDLPLYRYLGGINARLLPTPMFNIINGGAHAGWNLDIQEFMIIPAGMPSFSSAIKAGSEIFHTLKFILSQRGIPTTVGDEGGFAPRLASNEEAIELILAAIEKAGYSADKEIFIGLDSAASGFYDANENIYRFKAENREFSSADLVAYYQGLVERYPILSIEDGMSEDDLLGWEELTRTLGERIQIVGDDIFVTNATILREGIHRGIGNAILIKPNQIGTISETLQTMELARSSGYGAITSHRSGETEDTTIADLAVATGCGQIKTGSLCRSERVAKFNQLLRIEEELGSTSVFAGLSYIKGQKRQKN